MNKRKLNLQEAAADYALIERAIHYLEKHQRRQPTLKEVADSVNLSEYHFQRLFTRWVGISPKRFLQFLTKENAKRLLAHSSLLDATYQTGLSSTGRLHDLFIHTEALMPGQIKHKEQVSLFATAAAPHPLECLHRHYRAQHLQTFFRYKKRPEFSKAGFGKRDPHPGCCPHTESYRENLLAR